MPHFTDAALEAQLQMSGLLLSLALVEDACRHLQGLPAQTWAGHSQQNCTAWLHVHDLLTSFWRTLRSP